MELHDTRILKSLRRIFERARRVQIASAAIVAVIVAITILLATITPKQRYNRGLRSTVLVPLYIYPVVGAWDHLYEAIITHPNLNFTVILNPDNGPGPFELLEDDYIPQIEKLNTHPNVQTVGYVRTGYATRNITSVLSDVFGYSGWATNLHGRANAPSLAVHGIFFDEIPSEYSSEVSEYLKTINQAVKSIPGLLPDRKVIHNPGTIPDIRFSDPSTDLTVVFEGSYQTYQAQQARLASLPLDRTRYSYVVNSVPTGMSGRDLKNFVNRLSQDAEFIFLTDQTKNYYETFGRGWFDFIDTMETE